MINADTIISKLTGGKQLPKSSMHAEDWLSWYRGDVLGFHNYRLYNGNTEIEMKRKTLQMAKQVAETWANLLMNERCDIVLPDKANKSFQEMLNKNNFWLKANEGTEISFAVGMGAFIINVRDLFVGERSKVMNTSKSWVSVDYVDRFKMRPITIENKEITECAFISEGSDATNIVVHMKNDKGNYVIYNYVISKDGDIKDSYEFDTKSELRWFFIVRPNLSNNLRTSFSDEELGLSIYANSIDTLKAIDNKYDGFDIEFVLGRKRIFVATEAWNFRAVTGTDGKTKKIPSFDPYDYTFYHLPDNSDGKPLVTDQSGAIRHESYIQSINTELNILSMKCGLGESYYKFNGSVAATATQVMSENSTLFRSIKKHEILLESVLRNMTKTIIYATNTFTSTNLGEIKDEDIKIIFDDSIIEDKEAEMVRDRADVAAGIMTQWEYRAKWYGETDDDAKRIFKEQFLFDKINKYTPAITQGLMTPLQFVDIVYGKDVDGHDDIVAYIDSFLKSGQTLDMSGLYAGVEGEPEDETKDDEVE